MNTYIDALRRNPTSVDAIYALSEVVTAEAVAVLAEVAEASGQRAAVANTLGRIAMTNPTLVSGNQQAMTFLLHLLRALGSMSRANAAFALGWARSAEAIEPLRDALKDEDDVVRENARKALDQIGA